MTDELETAVALELFKEQAEKVCDKEVAKWREVSHCEAESNGAGGCADAIRALPTSPYAAEAKRIIEDAARWRHGEQHGFPRRFDLQMTWPPTGPSSYQQRWCHPYNQSKHFDSANAAIDAARQEDKT